jgi:hypothetical protein
MLKTVSSVANAIGALNYKGTWNASTNTPALASGVGTQGDYYVVSVSGATNLDGIINWGIGDWATFNGSVWQRVEGGADGNFVNLDVSGTSTLTSLSATTGAFSGNVIVGEYASNDIRLSEIRTNKSIFSINADGATNGNGTTISYSWANGGQGPLKFNNAAGEVASFTASGNLAFVSGNGIDFSATAGTGTSELLDDYEEGEWTPEPTSLTVVGTPTYTGKYTRIGRQVTCIACIDSTTSTTATSGATSFAGLPFTAIAIAGNNSGNGITVDTNSVTQVGSGYIYTPNNRFYVTGWTATANIVMSFTYFV